MLTRCCCAVLHAVAPVCTSKPTKRTAVQDTLGRLWWFESGLSCCYRDAQGASLTYPGYVQVRCLNLWCSGRDQLSEQYVAISFLQSDDAVKTRRQHPPILAFLFVRTTPLHVCRSSGTPHQHAGARPPSSTAWLMPTAACGAGRTSLVVRTAGSWTREARQQCMKRCCALSSSWRLSLPQSSPPSKALRHVLALRYVLRKAPVF